MVVVGEFATMDVVFSASRGAGGGLNLVGGMKTGGRILLMGDTRGGCVESLFALSLNEKTTRVTLASSFFSTEARKADDLAAEEDLEFENRPKELQRLNWNGSIIRVKP